MFMELYREEKRKEGDRGGQEDKGGNRKERDPASNKFPKCSPLSGTHRDSESWVEKRRGRTIRELINGWIYLSPFDSPLLSSWPSLSPFSLFSSLYNSMNISEWSRLWHAHKKVITG